MKKLILILTLTTACAPNITSPTPTLVPSSVVTNGVFNPPPEPAKPNLRSAITVQRYGYNWIDGLQDLFHTNVIFNIEVSGSNDFLIDYDFGDGNVIFDRFAFTTAHNFPTVGTFTVKAMVRADSRLSISYVVVSLPQLCAQFPSPDCRR